MFSYPLLRTTFDNMRVCYSQFSPKSVRDFPDPLSPYDIMVELKLLYWFSVNDYNKNSMESCTKWWDSKFSSHAPITWSNLCSMYWTPSVIEIWFSELVTISVPCSEGLILTQILTLSTMLYSSIYSSESSSFWI